ncbi:MAG: chromosome segregation protein SMC, partial [Clostridiales bacterium]|nr:chromosome segregation protein SMC [Clostridiales bacterium]
MYLKRLELQGFKSFPEKIKLDFNKGITAVVGPNGSGKSNISDAIRWVLGEQSAKSLRGAKMEDIIFAGTQNRKALGFAEVSMTIDNTNRRMNIAFSEITVTRRVYRSGESQFYINDTACRLKDIHELFMDTGIGREGYSIIGQGRIDEILSVKSEDRRLLFEEAAGIVKYKNRKHEAETKLERERQNLIRINDIISELENQLEPLAEQAEKAKAYLALAERLKMIDIHLFVAEVARAESDLQKIDDQSAGLSDHIAAETAAQETERERTESFKALLLETESAMANHTAFTAELRSSLEKKESDIKLCHQQIDHIHLDVSRLNREIILKREAINNENDNKMIYESKHSAAAMELAAKKEALAAKQQAFDAVDETLSRSEAVIDRYSADHIEKLRLSSESEGKIQRTEGLYEQLEQRKEELASDRGYNQSKINDNDTKLMVLQKNLGEQELLQEKLGAELEKLNAEKSRMDAVLQETAQQLNAVSRQADDRVSRHKLLTELENSYEGYYKSVKAVLRQKKNNPAQFSGIRGAVGELIDVSRNYETAIEIALGGALQNIITNTEKDAETAINYLKTAKEGRATFLPISSIKGKTLGGAKEKLLKEPGILGVAKDLVRYDSAYEGILSNLLDKVLVADNLQSAVAFSKKYSYQYKLVTTEGDLINPGGAMTGGSAAKGQSNILSRSREIAALKEEITRLTAERDGLREKQAEFTQKRAAVSERASRNNGIIREAEVQKASLNANIAQITAVLAELRETRADYEIEERQLMAQIAEVNKEIRALREGHARIEAEIAVLLESVDAKQSALQQERQTREILSKELTNIKVAISTV